MGWKVFVVLNEEGAKTPLCATIGKKKWVGAKGQPGRLAEFVQWVAAQHGQGVVHLSGLSNGGIVAWDLLLAHPHLFASLIVFPRYPSETNKDKLCKQLEGIHTCPICVAIGSRDMAFANASKATAQLLKSVGHPSASREVHEGGGHQLHQDDGGSAADSKGVEGAQFPISPERFTAIVKAAGMVIAQRGQQPAVSEPNSSSGRAGRSGHTGGDEIHQGMDADCQVVASLGDVVPGSSISSAP